MPNWSWPFGATSSSENTRANMGINSASYRAIAWLTLIPTFFTFIAIILINVGGVDPSASYNYWALTPERNTAYNVVNWNYTVTPTTATSSSSNTPTSYAYHLYLNRLCGLTADPSSSAITSTCRNNRINGWIYSGVWLWAPNSLIFNLSPFSFNSVDLNAAFAFYILAAFWCLVMMVPGLAGARHFASRMISLVNSGITFLFILIASATLTSQADTLKRQLNNNTISPVTTNGITYTVDVNSVSIGSTFLGLTWAATSAMFLETLMWCYAIFQADEREEEDEEKRKIEMNGGGRQTVGGPVRNGNANGAANGNGASVNGGGDGVVRNGNGGNVEPSGGVVENA